MAIFDAPPLVAGLLGQDEAERLRKQAIGTGLLSAVIGGLSAAPGYRYTGIAPIIGQALSSGMQGVQGTYTGALEDYQTQQKFAEMKRQEEQRKAQEEAIAQLPAEQQAAYRAFGAPAVPFIVEGMFPKKKERKTAVVGGQLVEIPEEGPGQPIYTAPEKPNLTDDIKEYQYAVDRGDFKGTFAQWQQMPRGTAAQTVVNVPERKFGEKFAESVADRVSKTYDNAVAATNTLETIKTVRPALEAGVFSGPLSKQERVITQLGAKLGVVGKDAKETLRNTSTAIQGLAQLELEAAQALRGQGQITENEREIIRRASAGRLEEFTAPEVQTLLNVIEKTSKFKIQAHEKNLSALRKRKDIGDLLNMYELPQSNKVKVNY